MSNISVSLTESNLNSLDRMVTELGLSGRSEAIRAAVRSLEDEVRDRKALSGTVEGALIVVEDQERTRGIDRVRHSTSDIIRGQVHSHLRDGRCIEVMVVRGGAEEVAALVNGLRADSGNGSVRLFPV
jgi:CopG family nickel-responsive transcriptional regulator